METSSLEIRVQRLPHGQDLPLPQVATEGSSGMDLRAALSTPLVLVPGGRLMVPTGICLEIPLGWEVQVRPRSGLALKYGVTVLNSPGTIDSDYRGEIRVILVNLGEKSFEIEHGERIAQAVLSRVGSARWEEVASLTTTHRGSGGFGSSGTR